MYRDTRLQYLTTSYQTFVTEFSFFTTITQYVIKQEKKTISMNT